MRLAGQARSVAAAARYSRVVREFLDAILAGADGGTIGRIPVPAAYRAAHVRKADEHAFDGVPAADKDPRRTIHVGEVPTPELAPDEALVAVMASSINFNTV